MMLYLGLRRLDWSSSGENLPETPHLADTNHPVLVLLASCLLCLSKLNTFQSCAVGCP